VSESIRSPGFSSGLAPAIERVAAQIKASDPNGNHRSGMPRFTDSQPRVQAKRDASAPPRKQ
jgi:hypothetical protein